MFNMEAEMKLKYSQKKAVIDDRSQSELLGMNTRDNTIAFGNTEIRDTMLQKTTNCY